MGGAPTACSVGFRRDLVNEDEPKAVPQEQRRAFEVSSWCARDPAALGVLGPRAGSALGAPASGAERARRLAASGNAGAPLSRLAGTLTTCDRIDRQCNWGSLSREQLDHRKLRLLLPTGSG